MRSSVDAAGAGTFIPSPAQGSPVTISAGTGSCLDARADRATITVFLWPCHGQESQQWFLSEEAGSLAEEEEEANRVRFYRLRWALDASQCIDGGTMDSMGRVGLAACEEGLPRQLVRHDPSPASEATLCFIPSATPGNSPLLLPTAACFTATPGTMGTPVLLWDPQSLQPSPPHARPAWSFEGRWHLQRGTSIRLLDDYQACVAVAGGSAPPRAAIQVRRCAEEHNGFRWLFDRDAHLIMLHERDAHGNVSTPHPPRPPLCLTADAVRDGSGLRLQSCDAADRERQAWDYDAQERSLRLRIYKAEGGTPPLCLDLVDAGRLDHGSDAVSSDAVSSRHGGTLAVRRCSPSCWSQRWTAGVGFATVGERMALGSLPAPPVGHPRSCETSLGGCKTRAPPADDPTSEASSEQTSRAPTEALQSTVTPTVPGTAPHGATAHHGADSCPPRTAAAAVVLTTCTRGRWRDAEVEAWRATAESCEGGWPLLSSRAALVRSPWCHYCPSARLGLLRPRTACSRALVAC